MSPGRRRGADGWAEVGRFVLSAPGGAGPCFLFDHLFPPHGRRERWLQRAARRSAALARRTLSPAGAAARGAGQALERTLGAAGEPWGEWIVARPHEGDRRGRLTAFLFPPGGELPDRVVKLRRPDGEGEDLAREMRALERLGGELPEPLRGTLPTVLRHAPASEETAGWELLVLTRLAGRSGYVELQGALAPGSVVGRHFRAAGGWLARFHRATLRREAPWRPPPWEEIAPEPGAPRPEWHRRLAAELEEAPWPLAAGHGDFWARNLLLTAEATAGGLPGVVDWEHHRPEAPPFEDLFGFAWSYARAYPWRGRRRDDEEAFERAFLRETVLAHAIRRYLADYARETGMDAGVLGELFRVFLLTRCQRGLYRILEGARRSVFSG